MGHGFASVEVGCGELGFGVDSYEASMVGFFGGVVAVAGFDWWVWWLLLALVILLRVVGIEAHIVRDEQEHVLNLGIDSGFPIIDKLLVSGFARRTLIRGHGF